MRTSNDLNKIVEEESETFTDKIIEIFEEFCSEEKKQLINDNSAAFNLKYKRREIQKQIDMSMFSHDSDPD